MKILTLVRTEFRRLTATGLARLALVALMLVPVIYAGLYLWANSDPYGNIKNIPVALVVEDTGATLDGKVVDYGQQVHDQLHRDNAADWIDASASDAAAGVRNGDYDFVLTLGPAFSTLLVSSGTATPQQAVVQLTTNDTNSFLASTIASSVAEKVRLSISEQVGEAAALQFLNGFQTVHDNLDTAVGGANQLVDGTAEAQAGAASLATGATTANSGAAALADGAAHASDGASTLSTGAASAADGATTLAAGAAQTNAGAQQLSSGLTALNGSVSKLDLTGQTAALAAGAKQVADGNAQLAAGVDQIVATGNGVTDDVAAARADIVQRLTAAGVSEQDRAAILDRFDAVGTVVTSGNAQVAALGGQVDALAKGAGQVSDGAATLAGATPALVSGISSAASGATQVARGTQQVSDGAATLASGSRQVADGSSSLATADAQLSDGASTLASGTQQLADGATSLSSGAAQLNSGSTQLRDGLVSGENEVPTYSDSQRSTAAAIIATPARVDTDTVTKASTYGAGMAPFFISLAAWIGIYALFLIIKPLSKRAVTAVRAPFRVIFAGWLAPALLGALQMAVVYFVVTVPLGFSVANPALMLLFMMFTSVTFVAIILALNVWLGSVGQFLGLVLMVLQLVTAGGTFPWQTLPAPLAALHHVLPMSYAVDGIRQLMYGGDLSLALNDVGVLAVWLVGAVAFSYFLTGRMTRSRTLRDLRPSLIG